jgi:hypothetical protein
MLLQLPPDVTAQRKPLSPTAYEYILRHKDFGTLGRILLTANAVGKCKVAYHVNPHVSEYVTAQRTRIFEPLARAIAESVHRQVRHEPGAI